MSSLPEFPAFKAIDLEDRAAFLPIIQRYQPESSEWTFTNLFMWRDHYRFRWSLYQGALIVLGRENGGETFAMMPLGPLPRRETVLMLLRWLEGEEKVARPRMERVDKRLVEELRDETLLKFEPARDHFDYVYAREELALLAGNKYRTKRNHINKFSRTYRFEYAPLKEEHLDACLELQSTWCEIRRCKEDLSLLGEWEAIREILAHFTSLDLRGGVVTIDGKVEAFTVGEMLNSDTMVVHIEKANPGLSELYTVINQQFAEACGKDAVYFNREQDLGIPGLREAKLSYHPHHMVEKFTVTLAGL